MNLIDFSAEKYLNPNQIFDDSVQIEVNSQSLDEFPEEPTDNSLLISPKQ